MSIIENEIAKYVLPNSGYQFSGNDFRMLSQPCVYLFLLDGLPLYIGMSSNGIMRPAQKTHPQADLARKECDQVLFYPCFSADAARNLEELLICQLSPKYNLRMRTKYVHTRLGHKRSYVNSLASPSTSDNA